MKIWRLGQIHENLDWPIFLRNNKLSFDWFDDSIDYSKVTNFKKHKGWTCIKPWVEELKVGDLIFIINKYSYGGVAIVSDTYKYKIFDIQINDYKLPSIPVQFLHKLEIPISHDLHIQAVRPKAFYHVNGIGFNMTSIMDFINKNYPDIYKKVNEYLYDNKEAESNKISKVCWNNHDWKKPSGSDGKDNSDKTYEGKFGFGHEEWIGENFREINGYHYGFLQALNLKSDLHVDKIYNIDLVANDRNGNFYHVGTINNGICISNQEANEVYNIYKKNGWIDEMLLEIKTVGGIHTEFKNDFVKTLFNLKYKSNDIHINTDFKTKMISSNDDNITTYHNKLLDKKSNFLYEKE